MGNYFGTDNANNNGNNNYNRNKRNFNNRINSVNVKRNSNNKNNDVFYSHSILYDNGDDDHGEDKYKKKLDLKDIEDVVNRTSIKSLKVNGKALFNENNNNNNREHSNNNNEDESYEVISPFEKNYKKKEIDLDYDISDDLTFDIPINSNRVIYKVKPNDTIEGIALQFGVTVLDLKRINNLLLKQDIFVKQKLIIPTTKDRIKEEELEDMEFKQFKEKQLLKQFQAETSSTIEDAKKYLNLYNYNYKIAKKNYLLDNLKRHDSSHFLHNLNHHNDFDFYQQKQNGKNYNNDHLDRNDNDNMIDFDFDLNDIEDYEKDISSNNNDDDDIDDFDFNDLDISIDDDDAFSLHSFDIDDDDNIDDFFNNHNNNHNTYKNEVIIQDNSTQDISIGFDSMKRRTNARNTTKRMKLQKIKQQRNNQKRNKNVFYV
eukprot:TRINITY_DN2640_c0_g2_i3.p1 TRINITY_DN2640_c0_g2~~TRINITY_DN2640_c0_g2_i3.p1  ORF type:complete len:429 (-),score=108.03 TRINITY_DN2640_c0_g2_i3:37-1323(-)